MSKQHRTTIGGQAVIEGVMMRGVKIASMSVRKPDNTISTETWNVSSVRDKFKILKLPLLRGVVNFVEMLIYGYKTLMRSAEIAGVEEEPSEFEKKIEKKFGDKVMKALMGVSSFIGVLIAVLLFVVLPAFITSKIGIGNYAKTVTEGLIRITLFIAYLAIIARLEDIKRVYGYHGAEHKTIYCYEHGEELTVENARKFKRLHPRCGTSFLLIVLVVSILVYSFVTWNSIPVRIALHIVLLPLVVGISYEIIKFAGRHDNTAMRFILAPGLWLQYLTTREPDDSQLEVAISALKAVLTGNPEDDKW